jgi:hypothetical protein
MEKQAREKCGALIRSNFDQVCNTFFNTVFKNDECVWLMFSKLINENLKEAKKNGKTFWESFENVICDILNANVILEVVFRHIGENWIGFIWPFGQKKKIYISLDAKNFSKSYILLQCVQIFLLCNSFSIKESDIHSQDMKYSNFTVNLLGNKYLDRIRFLKIIFSKLYEIHEKYFEKTARIAKIEDNLTDNMITCISNSKGINDKQRVELTDFVQKTRKRTTHDVVEEPLAKKQKSIVVKNS